MISSASIVELRENIFGWSIARRQDCPLQDNLNTHISASICEAYTAAVARRLLEKFEWHTSRQDTAAGSIWPSPKSLPYPANVDRAEAPRFS
jgi:hypothetical protein